MEDGVHHGVTIPAAGGRRIEQSGSVAALPGIRRLEWHESDVPDGRFRRMPLPDVVCTINLGVVGRYRLAGAATWHPFPVVAFRGVAREPSDGIDPPAGRIAYVSIVMAPWAVRAYLGVPAADTADRIVDGAALSRAWAALPERLADEPCGAARVAYVARWLAARASGAAWSPRAASFVDGVRDGAAVSDVARRLGVSARRVHQVCVQETGHSPATYRQVARFARLALRLHHAGRHQPWSAHVGDYADHSHAIRAFRRLAGVTPREYLAERPAASRTWSIVPTSAHDGRDAPGDAS